MAMNMGTAEGFKASGLNRRDYLNKINGLIRRPDKPSKPVKAELGPEMGESMSKAESKDVMSRFTSDTDGGKAKAQALDKDMSARKEQVARLAREVKRGEDSQRLNESENPDATSETFKKGGGVKKYAKGGSVTRGDGCAQRGKTRGMMR